VTVGQPVRAVGKQLVKRERIVAVAMEQFAANGYEGCTAESIAAAAGVSKGAVFGYFGTKAGLFLAAYQQATATFSKYLDAPAEVIERGFFAVISHWLEQTQHLIGQDWVPYRVTLLGNYCSDLQLRRSITQFLRRDDPYGTRAFVQFGIERGEVRADVDVAVIVSMVDWLMDRCQDAIVTEELDPGLFGGADPQLRDFRLGQFIELLRSAIGTGQSR
jgi:AcrR family transcriptional regulator